VKRRKSIIAGPGSVTPRKRRHRVETVLIIIGCVVLIDALIGERGLVAMARVRQELRVSQGHLDTARAEHERLTEQLRLLQDDPATIEDEARQLGLIKPGEKLFTIKELPPGSQSH
jgi:cell division protein FtsB